MLDKDFYRKWPDIESLTQTVSWREVARRGDIYFEPESPADVITRRTAFTAGSAWFPDERDFPALVSVAQDRIVGVTVYEDDRVWVIRRSVYEEEWCQPESKLAYSSLQIDFSDETRFPLRVATDLVNPVLGETMRIKIVRGGLPVRWDAEY